MPVAFFTAIAVSKLQHVQLGTWIAPCICNAGGERLGEEGVEIDFFFSATDMAVLTLKLETIL